MVTVVSGEAPSRGGRRVRPVTPCRTGATRSVAVGRPRTGGRSVDAGQAGGPAVADGPCRTRLGTRGPGLLGPACRRPTATCTTLSASPISISMSRAAAPSPGGGGPVPTRSAPGTPGGWGTTWGLCFQTGGQTTPSRSVPCAGRGPSTRTGRRGRETRPSATGTTTVAGRVAG